MRYYCNSEYRPLKSVLLSVPGPETGKAGDPGKALYSKRIDYDILRKEFDKLVKVYAKLKIKVNFINAKLIPGTDRRYKLNLMFARDLFFMTPKGAILSKMHFEIRRDEVRYAKRELKRLKVPLIRSIQGKGTLEGADALWVNEKLVLVGVGNRTNTNGFLSLKRELRSQGVECVPAAAPGGVLHLLGVLQFVDSSSALVRTELVDSRIIDLLKKNRISIIAIPENKEVRVKYAMNFVTVAPKIIIMPAGCHYTKKIYENSGIKVIAEVPATQLGNGGGGIGCATAVLSRG